MKKMAWLALLGLLAADAALAQTAGTNTTSQNGYYFNSKTGQQTNSDGHVLQVDTARDRDANLELTGGVSKSLAGGAADSSVVLDTHTMRLGMLLINYYVG